MILLSVLDYADAWDAYFSKSDKSEKERISKKIQQLKHSVSARHLKHGFPFFVVESGQYRVCFEEKSNTRTIMFAGNHKQYEKWVKKQK